MTQTVNETPFIPTETAARRKLADIRMFARVGNFEWAREAETELWEGVLEAVASGNAQAGYLAAAALESKQIDFPRI